MFDFLKYARIFNKKLSCSHGAIKKILKIRNHKIFYRRLKSSSFDRNHKNCSILRTTFHFIWILAPKKKIFNNSRRNTSTIKFIA